MEAAVSKLKTINRVKLAINRVSSNFVVVSSDEKSRNCPRKGMYTWRASENP